MAFQNTGNDGPYTARPGSISSPVAPVQRGSSTPDTTKAFNPTVEDNDDRNTNINNPRHPAYLARLFSFLSLGMNQSLNGRPAENLSATDFSSTLEAGFKFLEKLGVPVESLQAIRSAVTDNMGAFSEAFRSGTPFNAAILGLDGRQGNYSVSLRGEHADRDGVDLTRPTDRPVPVTSDYGFRTHPVLGGRRMHSGVDFGVGNDTNLVAPQDGRLVSYTYVKGYGNTAILSHGHGVYTMFAHLNSLAPGVAVGDTIARGAHFLESGNTGRGTGAHLHMEVWLMDQRSGRLVTVDPIKSINAGDLSNPIIQRQLIDDAERVSNGRHASVFTGQQTRVLASASPAPSTI